MHLSPGTRTLQEKKFGKKMSVKLKAAVLQLLLNNDLKDVEILPSTKGR